jgi:uncharacterized iron-regulated membrane protein
LSATVSERGAVKRPGSARPVFLKIHRWIGLTIGAFVVMAGLTGSLLSFHDRIDQSINSHLFHVQPAGTRLSPLELRVRAEQAEPRASIDSVRLDEGADDAAVFTLRPRIDPATGKPYELEADQLFLDPYTGEKIGERDTDVHALDREHVMETIFMLHRYLLLGDAGTKILVWVALAWFLSTIIGFYLTLPPKSRRFFPGWKPAWLVQWRAPLPRFAFDLHRATGLWLWILLFTVSFGAVRVTTGDLGLFDPMLKTIAPWKDAAATIEASAQEITEPKLTWANALDLGRKLMPAAAQREGFTIEREAALSLNRELGMYIYKVHGSMDVFDSGDTELYISALDGREIAVQHPQMAWGNSFSNWTWALHRARVGGTPWKTFVSIAGIATATLAITGFIVWLKRRRPSRAASARA